MALIFLCLGWLVGLYLGLAAVAEAGEYAPSLVPQTAPWIAGLAALALLAALLGRGDRKLWVTALAVVLGLLGLGRALGTVPLAPSLPRTEGTVALQGTVAGRPEPRDTALLLTLEVDGVTQGELLQRTSRRVLVRTDRYRDWGYGDRVRARGELRPVDPASGYWAAYLARQGIHATMEYPALQLVERPRGSDLQGWVERLRLRLEGLCARLLPEPHASLLAGILVGARATMPPDFRDALNATSTSHIVAVSGFNVTLVAGAALMVSLRLLARRKATLLAILLVWLYSLLTGLPPSATRAALMATLALLAVLAGRGGDALSFLCLSAALMVGQDPDLLHDLGFQLSFLATAGLVLLEPALRGLFGRLPGWLAGSLSVTLAAQLATLPILVGSFHSLSLISPLANLLIAPVLPWSMAVGAMAVTLGSIFEPLGQLLAPVSWIYLTYLVEVIRWTAQLPGAGLPTGNLEVGLAAVYYLLLLGVALWPLPEVRAIRDAMATLGARAPRWALAGSLAAGLSLAALGLSGRPEGKTHVYFLEVGRGEATLIRGPEGHNVLVDGGHSPTAITSALGRHLGFLDRGLDLVVLTGYQEERLAGLLEVARRHPIGRVLAPAGSGDSRAGRAWLDLVRERRLPVVEAAPGQRIDLGPGARVEVLWAPTLGGPAGAPAPTPRTGQVGTPAPTPGQQRKEETGALAVRLVAEGVSVILMGDLPRGVQPEVVPGTPGRVEVLRLPRGGAAGSLDERFLQKTRPRVAVVSSGEQDRLEPDPSTVDALRGAALLRTDRHGTIELVIGREGYEVFTER